jgi:hypothetical protein
MEESNDLLNNFLELDRRLDAVENRLKGESSTVRPVASWDDLLAKSGADLAGDQYSLRVCDHVAASIAGLSGGLLDLVPRLTDLMTSEKMHQRLDAFKEKARALAGMNVVAIDNALGGPSHRLVGPTHDVFRLFEAIACVRNGRFESAVRGVVKQADSYRPGLFPYGIVETPTDALILLLLHWSADFFSHMSLPIPGWSKLAEVNDVDFVRTLFRAYREGANLRTLCAQFLSNLSGLVLISLLLHLYRYTDMFWVSQTHEFSMSALNLRDDVRFRLMSRNANLVALSISSARVVATQNVFSLNYAAFFKFCSDSSALNHILGQRIIEIDARTDQMLAELEENR